MSLHETLKDINVTGLIHDLDDMKHRVAAIPTIDVALSSTIWAEFAETTDALAHLSEIQSWTQGLVKVVEDLREDDLMPGTTRLLEQELTQGLTKFPGMTQFLKDSFAADVISRLSALEILGQIETHLATWTASVTESTQSTAKSQLEPLQTLQTQLTAATQQLTDVITDTALARQDVGPVTVSMSMNSPLSGALGNEGVDGSAVSGLVRDALEHDASDHITNLKGLNNGTITPASVDVLGLTFGTVECTTMVEPDQLEQLSQRLESLGTVVGRNLLAGDQVMELLNTNLGNESVDVVSTSAKLTLTGYLSEVHTDLVAQSELLTICKTVLGAQLEEAGAEVVLYADDDPELKGDPKPEDDNDDAITNNEDDPDLADGKAADGAPPLDDNPGPDGKGEGGAPPIRKPDHKGEEQPKVKPSAEEPPESKVLDGKEGCSDDDDDDDNDYPKSNDDKPALTGNPDEADNGDVVIIDDDDAGSPGDSEDDGSIEPTDDGDVQNEAGEDVPMDPSELRRLLQQAHADSQRYS